MTKKTWIIIPILIAALFLRTYRVGALTGFYYDQGRDALIVWDLIHSHKFFLIGPTTGIEGIFLGPFYYYLITPFYWLGRGNPVFPVVELALINTLAIYLVYRIGRKYYSAATGILAAVFIAFSLYLTQAQRWLSNPTPLPLFAALVFWSVMDIISGKNGKWWLLGLCIGLSLQLEAASAVFFIPAVLMIFTLNRRSVIWSKRRFLDALFFFGITLLPQLWFNFRHGNILFQSFARFLISEKSFQPALTGFYNERLNFYYQSFVTKFTPEPKYNLLFVLAFILCFIPAYSHLRTSKITSALLTWWATPLVILLFYHGNHGYVWDYYFTGVFPFALLLMAAVFVAAAKKFRLLKILVGLVVAVFLIVNSYHLYFYLIAGTDGPDNVTLGSSLSAVDWVYADSAGRPFNVDAYVPPVIPYSYSYLFLWRGTTKYHRLPDAGLEPLLFTLHEVDHDHPQFLSAWMTRQDTIGSVNFRSGFGGITVENRTRYATK